MRRWFETFIVIVVKAISYRLILLILYYYLTFAVCWKFSFLLVLDRSERIFMFGSIIKDI